MKNCFHAQQVSSERFAWEWTRCVRHLIYLLSLRMLQFVASIFSCKNLYILIYSCKNLYKLIYSRKNLYIKTISEIRAESARIIVLRIEDKQQSLRDKQQSLILWLTYYQKKSSILVKKWANLYSNNESKRFIIYFWLTNTFFW